MVDGGDGGWWVGGTEEVIPDSGDAWAVCDSTRDTGILKTAKVWLTSAIWVRLCPT